jgi:putative Ca2+/H+ antiporter (TMEM165/GDT1 family)
VPTVLVAFAVVFVAELGDKTQIVALTLGARYPKMVALTGIAIAYAVTQGVAALLGGALGAALPTEAIGVAAGLLFLGFGGWTLYGGDDTEDEGEELAGRGTLIGIIGGMMLAELGDKSMLAGAALAADQPPLAVWIGATLGETAAGALAVFVGGALGTRISRRSLQLASGGLFLLFGVALLVDALA